MTAATERSKIVDYLRASVVTGVMPNGKRFALCEAEEHFNECVLKLAEEIEEGRHYR